MNACSSPPNQSPCTESNNKSFSPLQSYRTEDSEKKFFLPFGFIGVHPWLKLVSECFDTLQFARLVTVFAIALIGLSGCGQKDRSAGVELVMSSESPTPGMTFELRFPQPMVKADHIGVTESEPPLVISPSLAG